MHKLLKQLDTSTSQRTINKGANLLFQGEIPRKAYIVREGLVRSYTITSAGEERIVGLHGRGAMLPISWIFGATSNSLFYYDAVSDCQLVTLGKQEAYDAILSKPELVKATIEYLASEYTGSLLRINGLEQSRAIDKIGFTLYYLLFRYGEEKKPGIYTIDFKLSQQMIADLVGLTRESITKNLSLLKEKGVIDYSSSTYSIDKKRLENFIGEDGFRDLQLA